MTSPLILTLFATFSSLPNHTLPLIDAPPSTVKLPPDPIPVDVVVFVIYNGAVLCKRFDSKDNSDIDTSGFAPSPITILLAVKLVLPVPPYGTVIAFADHVPELIFPNPVTCDKLLFTLNVVSALFKPLPA